MNLLRNSIAVIVGLVLGGSVNMGIVMAGSSLIPPPAGVDPADADSIAAATAYGIGIAFLAGGITAATMIPAPAWFIAIDLVGAYLPMAWLALRISRRATVTSTAG